MFNRTTSVVDKMLEEHPHKNVVGRYSLQELVDGLEKFFISYSLFSGILVFLISNWIFRRGLRRYVSAGS